MHCIETESLEIALSTVTIQFRQDNLQKVNASAKFSKFDEKHTACVFHSVIHTQALWLL